MAEERQTRRKMLEKCKEKTGRQKNEHVERRKK